MKLNSEILVKMIIECNQGQSHLCIPCDLIFIAHFQSHFLLFTIIFTA